MTTITLPNNGTTFTLNGEILRNLAEGDQVTLTFPNARTFRVNSATGVTIGERSDADVADITIIVQKFSDDDVLLSGFCQSDPLTVIEGSIKSMFYKDGNKMIETYTIEAGSITEQPEAGINSQDGTGTMSYTLQSRRTRRGL